MLTKNIIIYTTNSHKILFCIQARTRESFLNGILSTKSIIKQKINTENTHSKSACLELTFRLHFEFM